MFRPPPGVRRKALFYVDLPTLLLSLIVGYPLGMIVTARLTGQPALGGIVGIFVMMLVFGFFRPRLQLRGTRGAVSSSGAEETWSSAKPAVVRSRSRMIFVWTLRAAAVTAVLGVWFALSEGDISPVTAGVRFGAIGAAPGFVIGLIAAMVRRPTR